MTTQITKEMILEYGNNDMHLTETFIARLPRHYQLILARDIISCLDELQTVNANIKDKKMPPLDYKPTFSNTIDLIESHLSVQEKSEDLSGLPIQLTIAPNEYPTPRGQNNNQSRSYDQNTDNNNNRNNNRNRNTNPRRNNRQNNNQDLKFHNNKMQQAKNKVIPTYPSDIDLTKESENQNSSGKSRISRQKEKQPQRKGQFQSSDKNAFDRELTHNIKDGVFYVPFNDLLAKDIPIPDRKLLVDRYPQWARTLQSDTLCLFCVTANQPKGTCGHKPHACRSSLFKISCPNMMAIFKTYNICSKCFKCGHNNKDCKATNVVCASCLQNHHTYYCKNK